MPKSCRGKSSPVAIRHDLIKSPEYERSSGFRRNSTIHQSNDRLRDRKHALAKTTLTPHMRPLHWLHPPVIVDHMSGVCDHHLNPERDQKTATSDGACQTFARRPVKLIEDDSARFNWCDFELCQSLFADSNSTDDFDQLYPSNLWPFWNFTFNVLKNSNVIRDSRYLIMRRLTRAASRIKKFNQPEIMLRITCWWLITRDYNSYTLYNILHVAKVPLHPIQFERALNS